MIFAKLTTILLTIFLASIIITPSAQAFDLRCQGVLPALEVTVKGLSTALATTQSSLPNLIDKASKASKSAINLTNISNDLRVRALADPTNKLLADQSRSATSKAKTATVAAKISAESLRQVELRIPDMKTKLREASNKLSLERKRCSSK